MGVIASSRVFTWDSAHDTLYLHNGGWYLAGLVVVALIAAAIINRSGSI